VISIETGQAGCKDNLLGQHLVIGVNRSRPSETKSFVATYRSRKREVFVTLRRSVNNDPFATWAEHRRRLSSLLIGSFPIGWKDPIEKNLRKAENLDMATESDGRVRKVVS
jgi:hypothetical protein